MSFFARALNTVKGQPRKNIVYVHIPKCGGSSIKDAIRRTYKTLDYRRDRDVVDFSNVAAVTVGQLLGTNNFEEHILVYYLALEKRPPRCIMGHVPFSEIAHREYGDRYAFVTLLRDPADRYISEYMFNKFKSGPHMKYTAECGIEEYIESEYGRAQGGQYGLYLGGRRPGNDYTSEPARSKAMENLHHFDLIGFLDDMDDFKKQFHEKFGVSLDIRHLNRSPGSSNYKKEEITDDMRRKIQAICDSDYQIYRYAQSMHST